MFNSFHQIYTSVNLFVDSFSTYVLVTVVFNRTGASIRNAFLFLIIQKYLDICCFDLFLSVIIALSHYRFNCLSHCMLFIARPYFP